MVFYHFFCLVFGHFEYLLCLDLHEKPVIKQNFIGSYILKYIIR